jgi:hypothetical protein
MMAIRSVFISSVQQDFGGVRRAAATALESLLLHPVMAEQVGASPESPKRALLAEVRNADYFLLLLAGRYGVPGVSGCSPTEDEFNEARRLGKPTVVLTQETPREATQEQFLARIRGGWEAGILTGKFIDETDVGAAVVRAFATLAAGGTGEDVPTAARRARELAAGDDRRHGGQPRTGARVVFVPSRSESLLDVVALEDPSLDTDLATSARTANVIGHQFGIETRVSAAGVEMHATGGRGWESPVLAVLQDGTVLVEGSVSDDGLLGGMAIAEQRVLDFLATASAFAQAAWTRIDPHDTVRRVSPGLALLDASMKGWRAPTAPASNSVSLSGQVPSTVVVPSGDLVVGRAQLSAEETLRRLMLEAKRVFLDAGRVQ